MKKLIAGSRGSTLALKQTQIVIDALQQRYPELDVPLRIITTKGDHLQDTPLAKIGGKGLFTKELEQSLFEYAIDFAVHSLKDLPVELPEGLTLAAYMPRETPNDALISKEGKPLHELPSHAIVATGSLRRKLQLLKQRSDLQIVGVRGNLETRVRKFHKNKWDGLVLAYAGLHRLGRAELISQILPEEIIYPAVGQGIIAVECRADSPACELFAAINDPLTETYALAERAFLQGLGGGCQVPVGVISLILGDRLQLSGVYLPENGKYTLTQELEWERSQPIAAGRTLAEKILAEYAEYASP